MPSTTDLKEKFGALENLLQELVEPGHPELSAILRQLAEGIDGIVSDHDEAINANRAKSEFIARMSHELRSPMNSILGYAQLLGMNQENTLTEQQLSNIGQIQDSGWHMLALINDVLDLSKIEAGRLGLKIGKTSLTETIDKAVQMSASDAMNRHIDVQVHNDVDPASEVYADPTRLRQVLINLVCNAIKYNQDGGRVDIYVSKPNDHFRIEVTDTGHGLPEEQIEKLFLPFERLGLEHSGMEGHGIGMSISYKLVDLMGGDIGAYNNETSGATFWFTVAAYTGQQDKIIN